MPIPAKLHFCWIGSDLPWAYAFAVLSAAEQSRIGEIILHHSDPLEADEPVTALARDPRIHVSRVDPADCLDACGEALGVGGRLNDLYGGLKSAAVKADILRAALLYLEGGLYLDMDTVSVRPLTQLLALGSFVGTERIIWPSSVRRLRSSRLLARSIMLDVTRKAARHLRGGWRPFRYLENFCYKAATNSVMGAERNAPFFARYLRAMLAAPAAQRAGRYAFGPDLLQDLVQNCSGEPVACVEPRVSSPLPPEISEHWFRRVTKPRLAEILFPETLVVHWYASVHTEHKVALITPRYVRDHHEHQFYSALIWSCVPVLRDLE